MPTSTHPAPTHPQPHTQLRQATALRASGALLLVALLVLLAGCGSGSTTSPAESGSSTTRAGSAGLTISDTYVKSAAKEGDMAMSAIFGVLSNPSDRDITLVSGSSEAASTVELHEMVMQGGAMKMQPRQGGFVVPAGSTLPLEPGGLHVMLIGLTRDIEAGDTVSATLTTSDGQNLDITAVGRDLANANESYAPADK